MKNQAVLSAVRAALSAAGLDRRDAVLLAAVSGGGDSVALLHALCALRPELGFALCACHVQHGLRGESSREDEAFVRALCHELRVPLAVADAGLDGGMTDPGVETRAREHRRRIFAEQMALFHADALLLAHHRDDQAETVLMHLLRGAGAAGLAGMCGVMPFAGGLMVRPFLSLPKRALLDAMEEEGLRFREDESNRQPCTPRNALRLEILPRLEGLFPGAAGRVAQAAALLQADDRCLTALADSLFERARYCRPPVFALKKADLLHADEALARRVLRRWVAEALPPLSLAPRERSLSSADTLTLLRLLAAGPGERGNLPHGLLALSGKAYLFLTRQDGEPLVPLPDAPPIPVVPGRRRYELAGMRFSLFKRAAEAPVPENASRVLLPAALLAQGPVLRLPATGDRIRPFGAPGSKPLRRFLTDRKIDLPFRRALPLLAIGPRVLWLPGLCAAEELRAGEPCADCFCLNVSGDIPYL